MVSIENLEKSLKNEELASIYLFYGEETYLLENSVQKIKKKFGQIIKGINYILIDETNINELISNMETPAFGYEKKLVIAKNTGLFQKDSKKKSNANKDFKEKINTYIKENIDIIKESNVLVFVEEEADSNTLYKTIDNCGVVCKFEYQKAPQIEKRIKEICNAYKVNIDNNTIRYFIECCGTSMQDLINEIRKLIEYKGENGTIINNDIDLLSIKQVESVIFDLTDNLGKKNIKQALQVLRNLIYSKEPIQKILVTLYNHFKKLYLVTIAMKNNKNIADSLKLKPNQMFLVNKYTAQAKLFGDKELRRILKELTDLDYKYKVGLLDLNIGLESILCTYCS